MPRHVVDVELDRPGRARKVHVTRKGADNASLVLLAGQRKLEGLPALGQRERDLIDSVDIGESVAGDAAGPTRTVAALERASVVPVRRLRTMANR